MYKTDLLSRTLKMVTSEATPLISPLSTREKRIANNIYGEQEGRTSKEKVRAKWGRLLKELEEVRSICDLCLVVGTSSVVYPAAMFAPQVATNTLLPCLLLRFIFLCLLLR